MVRIVIGIVLIALYVLGMFGNLLRIASGHLPLGVSQQVYTEAVMRAGIFGLLIFVLPGVLLIVFGRKARKRKTAAAAGVQS